MATETAIELDELNSESNSISAGKENRAQVQVLVHINRTDKENALNFTKFKKWVITLIISISTLCVTFASSSVSTATDQLHQEFPTASHEKLMLTLSCYVFAVGLSPLFASPLSEFYGRRPIYVVSMLGFCVFHIPVIFCKNLDWILVFRTFQGLSAGAFVTVAGGTIADMFTKEESSVPLLIFSSSPFLGPSLGPLIAGFVLSYTSWRWLPITQVIWSGIMLFSLIVFYPETHQLRLETLKAQKLRRQQSEPKTMVYVSSLESSGLTFAKALQQQLTRPWYLFFDPALFILNTLTAIILSILYLFIDSYSLIYSSVYGFNLWQVGLVFSSFVIGIIIAGLLLRYVEKLEAKFIRISRHRDQADPEVFLLKSVFGTGCSLLALFLFTVTIRPSVPWLVPAFTGIPFAFGMVFLFSGVFSYIIHAYRPWAASALATNAVYRCTLASAFPLFGHRLYDNLGFTKGSLLVSCIVLALFPFPVLFYLYGDRLRARSRIMKTVWTNYDD